MKKILVYDSDSEVLIENESDINFILECFENYKKECLIKEEQERLDVLKGIKGEMEDLRDLYEIEKMDSFPDGFVGWVMDEVAYDLYLNEYFHYDNRRKDEEEFQKYFDQFLKEVFMIHSRTLLP